MKRKIPRRYRYKTLVKKIELELTSDIETEEFKEIESDPILRWSWTSSGRLYLEVNYD